MTNTTSDFGKELDSLADVITFGVAPSILAFTWGFRMLPMTMDPSLGCWSSLAHSSALYFCSAAPAVSRVSISATIRSRRIPAGRIANTSSACPFLPRRA